ncbi:hypothetical protein U1Q18_027935, partial [Sarracenia purpurea var. burkii]
MVCEHCLLSPRMKTMRGYLELSSEFRIGAVCCCVGSFKLGAFHGVVQGGSRLKPHARVEFCAFCFWEYSIDLEAFVK